MRALTNFFKQPILIAVFMAMLITHCGESDTSTQNRNGTANAVIPSVEAVQARYGSLPLSERLSGTVKAENQVSLYPELSARIEAVYVKDGDFVHAGDTLIKLNNIQYREQLQQAKSGLKINQARLKQVNARLKEAQANYNRIKTLADKDLSSKLELETAEAQLESARADVELVKAQLEQSQALVAERENQLSKTVLRAPISGRVGNRNAEIGMQVNTGSEVVTIGNLEKLIIEVILTENMLSSITTGQTAHVFVNRKGDTGYLTAELSRISPFLNPVTRTTQAEIDISNYDDILIPGMFVPVDILYGESEQATLIPKTALYTNPLSGETGVYVASSIGSEIVPVESDSDFLAPLTEPVQITFKPISVLARGRMNLGVTGINNGDWIVTIGQNLLSSGRSEARVRTVSWIRVIALQQLKREDLLDRILSQPKDSNSNPKL